MTKKETTTPKKPAIVIPESVEGIEVAKEKAEIRVIERVIENREIAPHDAFGKLSRSQVELIKRTYAKGASDDELNLFVTVCHGLQLSPFSKQVHLVPRWDSKLGREVRQIQVGIDGFRATAEKTGKYAGNDDPAFEGEKEVVFGDKGQKVMAPAKATTTVWKMVEGQRFGFTATARWEEYYPGAKIGYQWHQKPYLMLGKCAEALALRKAFPALLSGIYAPEEMDKGRDEEKKDENQQKNFENLKTISKTMNGKELSEYKEKINKSDKYTAEQKYEFAQIVDARLQELQLKGEPTE